VTETILGGGGEENIFCVFKVPSQCQLIFLLQVTQMIGIPFRMMLEGLPKYEV
jgi:hypothetical protein